MNNFLVRVILMLKILYFRVTDWLLGRKVQHKHIDAETGELLVSGKDHTEINLPTLPRIIEVKFKHEHRSIPCDHHHDKLDYEICRHEHQYKLIIKWHVSSLREITWIAYF